ncbi:mitochondrial genome maintenance MGM101 [Xylaria cf. heliscus]|nr:mitochondrial genome maintenance MGM101 [Xylaria cf. heliscus]
MASRTMSPLQATSRRICLAPRTPKLPSHSAARRLATTPIVRAYPPYPPLSSSITPSSTTTSATKTTAPPIPPRSTARVSPYSATTARKPIPAVSGEPLPDAPSATIPATPSSVNGGGQAAANNNNGEGAQVDWSNSYYGNGNENGEGTLIDWTKSYHGLGTSAFGPETATILQARLDPDDIEVKPDGIIYLPEIKYRRILNAAFGPGGWGLAPRGELMVQERIVTREYALVVNGRFVGQARGEQQYFSEDGVSTAAEGAKSNALMRCCKDLGIASELWDPRFIRKFMKEHAVQQWVEHVTTKKKKQIWLRKDDEVRYPFKKS